ncbi:hypothetical protein AB0O67_22170 [Streptomyces sp. NPDC086077]|uniref:hypothetical protein n=1 Tax=Streptomyces sp. NPDC086077 TaxID=3154862 RepID=UPI00342ABA24
MRHFQRSDHRTGDPSLTVKQGILSMKKILAATVLALTVTACDSSHDTGLSYPAPDNICGISAEKKVLESLLDDGSKLEQDTDSTTLTEGQFCHMYVDGNDSVVSDADWHESGYDLRDHLQYRDVKDLRYLPKGNFASWNSGVAAIIPCPGISEKGDVLSVEVSDIHRSKSSQELLEKLVPSYFEAYREKLGCGS